MNSRRWKSNRRKTADKARARAIRSNARARRVWSSRHYKGWRGTFGRILSDYVDHVREEIRASPGFAELARQCRAMVYADVGMEPPSD